MVSVSSFLDSLTDFFIGSNVDCVHTSTTSRIMEAVGPYFLAAYQNGSKWDKKTRVIQGVSYSVERANHGLAHGLRQGALAKDIFSLLIRYPAKDSSGIVEWAKRKHSLNPKWSHKLQIAASYQRSGRQSECSSVSDPALYKAYEMQDTVNLERDAARFPELENEKELLVLKEAILWSNPGTLKEDREEDLMYARRILHAAHTLDLRRMRSFDGNRIQRDALDQLFNRDLPPECQALKELLWDRSGEYLRATGDRDLVLDRNYQDSFFTQSRNPSLLVDAICKVSARRFFS